MCHVMIKPGNLWLVSGELELSDYQFGSRGVHHLFRKHCGVCLFGRGHLDKGGDFYSINLTCLVT